MFDKMFGKKEKVKESIKEINRKTEVEKFVVFIVTNKPSLLSSHTGLVRKLLNQCNIYMREGLEVIVDVNQEVARKKNLESTIPFFTGRAVRVSREENLEYEIGEMEIRSFYSPELAVSGWIASIPMFRK